MPTGSAAWREQEQGKIQQRDHISPVEAKSILEQFRAQAVWSLCGNHSQAGLMDGDGSSFKVRIGSREKSVSEYGDVAPPVFREVEARCRCSHQYAPMEAWRSENREHRRGHPRVSNQTWQDKAFLEKLRHILRAEQDDKKNTNSLIVPPDGASYGLASPNLPCTAV